MAISTAYRRVSRLEGLSVSYHTSKPHKIKMISLIRKKKTINLSENSKYYTPPPLLSALMATVGFRSPPAPLCTRRSFSSSRVSPARHLAFRVRSSAVEESTSSPPPTDTPVESQKLSASLISAANVQKALRGIGWCPQNAIFVYSPVSFNLLFGMVLKWT